LIIKEQQVRKNLKEKEKVTKEKLEKLKDHFEIINDRIE
jgi:uncharacterized protein YlxP (DUF503 family)